MKRFLLVLLAGVGGVTLLLALSLLGLVLLSSSREPGVPEGVVLELDVTQALPEHVAEDSLAGAFGERPPTVRDVVDALERAGEDGRVKGLVVRLGHPVGSIAVVQELRDAVKAFRARGKKAWAYADTFGEGDSATGTYYLASAFDAVWVQPSGDVSVTGVGQETPFVRDALARLGVKPQMGRRYEYKAAVNTLTEQTYTAPHREESTRYFQSVFEQLVRGIAEERDLTAEQVRAAIDEAPLTAARAQQLGLVDGLFYRDEVYTTIKAEVGGEMKRLFLEKYLARAGRPHEEGPVVALVYGVGTISRGKSETNPMSGETTLGGDTVAAALRKAVDDKRVKALVFRVDSPGGSYVASDTVRREVQRARELGKPVIVTMGTYAASGGYFVAMAADKIVAQPGTLTGSIGVYGGKIVTQGLWEKLGVNWAPLGVGRNATLYSSSLEYTPEQLAQNEASLDRVYEDFTLKAAAGRHLPVDQLREVARGRIWSGEDARERGLVDELGGFPVALRLAREAAKLSGPVRVEVFPKPKGTAELVVGLLGDSRGENSDEAAVAARLTAPWAPVLGPARVLYRVAVELGLADEPRGVLSADVPEPLP